MSSTSDMFEERGDCIGFGRAFGGTGAYIQSDIQYAQQVRMQFRNRLTQEQFEAKRLPSSLQLSFYMRFFVDEEGTVQASELFMEPPELEDGEEALMGPEVHGTHFGSEMFGAPLKVDMTDSKLTAFHFSASGYGEFLGVTTQNVKTGQYTDYLTVDKGTAVSTYTYTEAVEMPHETTRLVGFRTSLRCRQTQAIRQIQPVFYSIDQTVCTGGVLGQIPRGMLSETGAFGMECSDASLQSSLRAESYNLQVASDATIFQEITLGFLFLVLLAALSTCFFHFTTARASSSSRGDKQRPK